MNILVYSHFYPAPANWKMRTDTLIVHYFAKELQKAGHTVQVIYLSSTPVQRLVRNRFRHMIPVEADYVYEGVPVHLIRFQSLTPHRSFPEAFQAPIINKKLRAFKQGLGWKPDKVFIHFPTVFTGLTEILADGVPVLGDFHNIDIMILNRSGGDEAARFIRKIRNWGFRNNRIQMGLTEVEKRTMCRVYSGIDKALLAPKSVIHQKAGRPWEKMRVVYAGRLIPLKHVDLLIQAVQKLSFEYELTIVGDGPEMKRLLKLADNSPHIHFTGQLSRRETVTRMRESDVFVMLSSPETYGLVYLEAAAQGCIIVASKGEGFDGVIMHGENGFLEMPNSIDAARRILETIHALDDAERKRLIFNGYQLAVSMTEDQTAQMLLEANC